MPEPQAKELPESLIKAQYAVGELEAMIGMQDVVTQLTSIISSHVVARSGRRVFAQDKTRATPLHMFFDGNPGTGKTTVARLVGDIFHGANILKKGHLYEVKSSDLIGKYIGHTAPKVANACEEALGGVLFIDEAYDLARNEYGFGAEAVTELIQHMENARGEFMVIFAGYPHEMKRLLESNPGLSSRVPYKITFRDYNRDELAQIFKQMAKQQGVLVENDKVTDRVVNHLWQTRLNDPDSFGNARDVRNLIQRLSDIARSQKMADSGMGNLKSVLAVASGVEKMKQVDTVVITDKHFQTFLQSTGPEVIAKNYGFDLKPR